jgi:succinate dehydrogenase / fumarate reductase flavoprotein subunit
MSQQAVSLEEKRLFNEIFHGIGTENPYEIHNQVQTIMDDCAYVYRTGEGVETGLRELRTLRKRAYRHVEDKAEGYNTNFINVPELEAMFGIAEFVLADGFARTESRGAHAMTDYLKRAGQNWLKHTRAYHAADDPRLEYSPVTITKYQPTERLY